jgi:DNA-binding SARP family transcriptional activator
MPLPVPSRGVRLLLAALALAPRRAVPRATFAAYAWPDADETQAKANLRKTVHHLKQVVPAAERVFDLRGRVLSVCDPQAWQVEVIEVLAAIHSDSPQQWEHVLRRCEGELLPEDHAPWLDQGREWVRSQRCQLWGRLLAYYERT